MDLNEASKEYNIPVQALRAFKKQGLITSADNLTPKDLERLAVIAQVWGKESYIRIQVSRLKKTVRERILQTNGLNKIETYMLRRYVKTKNAADPKTVQVKSVVSEVMKFFRIPESPLTEKKLSKIALKMREKAKYLCNKKKQQAILQED